jgi:hypothetical protein
MAFEKSQSYKVDGRYKEAKGMPDNNQALGFLENYLETRRSVAKLPITQERRQDDRFIFPAQGGTIPIAALPYEPRGSASFGNTDSSAGFRNSFRVTPS